MMEEKQIQFTLTIQEANIVFASLQETPVMKLIRKIEQQAKEQLPQEHQPEKTNG